MDNATHLRIVTWNLWGHGAPGPYLTERGEFRGAWPGSRATKAFDGVQVWRHRRPLLARILSSIEPDIVCLQECLGTGTSLAHDLAADLGLSVYEDAQSPGLAILSRLPVKEVNTLSHLQADWLGYAKPLHAIAEIGSMELAVLSVHLPLARYGPRDHLIDELGAWQSSVTPTILAGDLNAPPTENVIGNLLAAGYLDVSAACGPTMPNPQPVVRLDYVLARSGVPDAFSVVSTDVLGLAPDADGFLPSDHAGIAVALAYST